MEPSRAMVAFGLVCYALSRVEYSPAFLPAMSRGSSTMNFGSAAGLRAVFGQSAQAEQRSAGIGLPVAGVAFMLGAVGAGARKAVQRRAERRPVDKALYQEARSGCVAPAYAQILTEVAIEKKEQVLVTKDVMRMKKLLNSIDWVIPNLVEPMAMLCDDWQEQAMSFVEKMGPFESTVMPKFIRFCGKKWRLHGLKDICDEYINALYFAESIAPVKVTSALPLTDDQKSAIKEKMKSRTRCADIKLVNKVKPSINGGMKIQWDFMDPDDISSNAEFTLDFTLGDAIKTASLEEGVVV